MVDDPPFARVTQQPQLLAQLQRLADEGAGTLGPEAVMQLRRRHPAELIAEAVELVNARAKGTAKFGEHAARMLADAVAMEQASSLDVASHKARRFATIGPRAIVDLCCGIGGDAIALAEVATVLAIDRDYRRAWMTRHNVQTITGQACTAVAADVNALRLEPPPGDAAAFHLDPDRRSSGRRSHAYADLEPGPAFIDRLRRHWPDGAIKLSPGVDLDGLPAAEDAELEIIQRHRSLVQAVWWIGRLATADAGVRTATLLPEGAQFRGLSNLPIPVARGGPRRYLLGIEPAIERAGLIGALAEHLHAPAIHPALGLLTADEAIQSPWLTPFELLAEMPWRLNKVRQWLRDHDGGLVEIKTRGGAVDPDPLQKKLRGSGDQSYTLHILRFERRLICYITRRVDR